MFQGLIFVFYGEQFMTKLSCQKLIMRVLLFESRNISSGFGLAELD